MDLKFKLGDTFGPTGDEYEIINEPGREQDPSQDAIAIGEGSAGSVYCARFRGRITRAVKFHNPKHGSSGQSDSPYLRTFSKETEFLSSLRHHNIVKLIDFDIYETADGEPRPYFVMDYVEGRNLLDVCRDPSVDSRVVLELFESLIDAVCYLHSQRVLHADIKSSNIRCQGDDLVLLDLGAAHRLPDDPPDRQAGIVNDPNELTHFVSTPEIAHERHQDKVGKWIRRSDLLELFPYYDLHAIGLMLQAVLVEEPRRQDLRQHLGKDGMTALGTICEQLLRPPDDPHYASADELKADWLKLGVGYLAPMGIPEMSLAARFKHSILTPAGRITITERLQNLIRHKLFQRLRDIPQLELISLKYPGAKHSRLQHATSVYGTAREYLAHLLNHATFRLTVTQHDVEACLLLALLHDIGHYQLSHMFEDYAAEQRLRVRHGEQPENQICDDDDLFPAVFDGGSSVYYPNAPYSEVVKAAWKHSTDRLQGRVGPSLAEVVLQEFSEATLEAMRGIRAALHRPSADAHPAHLILAGVLSSPIDVDKVSYLQDDAAATGISFGRGIDLDGLLGALMPPQISDLNGRPTIGLSDKGIAAAESVAVCRQLMFRQVYWHHTNRGTMAMVKYALSRLLEADRLIFAEYLEQHFFAGMEQALRWVFDRFEDLRDKGEANPVGGVLEGEHRYYRRFLSISNAPDPTVIIPKLRSATTSEILQLEHQLASDLSSQFSLNLRPGDVLLDIPVKDRGIPGGSSSARTVVYPRDSQISRTSSGDLGEDTPWLRSLRDEFDRLANKVRVFVQPEHYDTMKDLGLRRVQEATQQVLE